MDYSNKDVLRQDRLLAQSDALGVLKTGEYGVLSMVDELGKPYAIPMSYVWDGGSSIYLHCAPEGKKLKSLDKNNIVSYCIVGHTNVISSKFTTEYESIILECEAHRNLPDAQRMKAMELLLEKYSLNHKEAGMKSAKRSLPRTEVIRLDIKHWSGKTKRV